MTVLISVLLIVGTVKVSTAAATESVLNVILFQRNMYLMVPFVLLGIFLAVGLLVSVVYSSVMFFIDGETLKGALFLGFGLAALGLYSIERAKENDCSMKNFSDLRVHVAGRLQFLLHHQGGN